MGFNQQGAIGLHKFYQLGLSNCLVGFHGHQQEFRGGCHRACSREIRGFHKGRIVGLYSNGSIKRNPIQGFTKGGYFGC